MRVITVQNQKGGSGKTTAAAHLGTALQRTGASVLLIDADRQGSLTDFAAVSETPNPLEVRSITENLAGEVKALADYDYLVIDGPPSAALMARQCMEVSDLVIFPVNASPLDIWGSSDTIKTFEQVQKGHPGIKGAFILSRVIPNTKILTEAREGLTGYGLPVLKTELHQRVAYPVSMAQGLTVFDTEPKNSQAIKEIEAMTAEILELLKEGKK